MAYINKTGDGVDPWGRYEVTFELSNATVSAKGDLFGTLFEAGLDLEVVEGRYVLWGEGEEDSTTPGTRLDYNINVSVKGVSNDGAMLSRGMIIIEGVRDNGWHFRIEGSGIIGRTTGGEVAVTFWEPPEMSFPHHHTDYGVLRKRRSSDLAPRPAIVDGEVSGDRRRLN